MGFSEGGAEVDPGMWDVRNRLVQNETKSIPFTLPDVAVVCDSSGARRGHPIAGFFAMRPTRLTLTALLAVAVVGCAQPAEDVSPRLVVMISVDQLRGDLLDRYSDAFTGGFRRLLDEGAVYTGASHRHASTSTGIGHTTLGTGVVPTRHGIVGNSWEERLPDGSFRSVYAVEDSLSPIVGFPNAPGRSPANIRTDGLADWLQAADPETKVLSVSTKDRGAIPLAGQARGDVYWMMANAGRFATSTYYQDDYPDWVERFNRERMPQILGDSVWTFDLSADLAALARPDMAAYEGDGEHTTFPHMRAMESSGDGPSAQFGWASRTPLADEATLEFALEAMSQLGIGADEHVDYMALSFSATDYVGHAYGPLSQEQLDNLVHLDRTLGRLMTELDARVGEGAWVLGLSADHGVITMPEWLAENGEPGYRTSRDDLIRFQMVADSVAAAMEGSDETAVQTAMAEALERIDWVHDVMLPSELLAPGADSLVNLFVNSYDANRYWSMLPEYGLYVMGNESTYVTSSPTGTGHGSVWWHDRWVPLILYGPGIDAARLADEVYTVDLAPTLASLVGVAPPAGIDGRALRQ